MFINIDKSMVLDKFDSLIYCYCKFRSLDEEKGYYNFNTDSLLEDMNFKNNERNWAYIDEAIKNLDRKGKLYYYEYADNSYVIVPDGYEPDMLFYFRLYKHEFDLLIDETKSPIENSKLLHYYCWLLSHLDLKTQTFAMSYDFIHEGYDITDKTVKKRNDKLVGLGLISVNTEYKDGMYTSNFYKRLYAEETMLDKPADIDAVEELDETDDMYEIEAEILENVETKPTVYVNSDADAPIEKIKFNLAKQGDFYLCSDDLIGNDIFDVDENWTFIEELLLKYRGKFNGKTSELAVKELNKCMN